MSLPLTSYYEKLIEKHSLKLHHSKKILNRIVWSRFLAFLMGLLISIILIRMNSWTYVWAFSPFLAIFLYLVKKHEKQKWIRTYYTNRIQIDKEELASIKGDQSSFDHGADYTEASHPYSSDLDLFGKNSLFQYLNRSISHGGAFKLAENLKNKSFKSQILQKQNAVRELSELVEWRHDFRANGLMLEDDKAGKEEIEEWLHEEDLFYRKKSFHILAIVLPVLTAILFILSIWFIPVRIPILLMLVQLAIVGRYLRKINRQHVNISRKHELIRQFGNLFSKIENQEFRSSMLLQLQADLKKDRFSAQMEIDSLSNLLRLFDNRLNMIAGFLLNGFLLWDIQCLIRMEKWKNSNRDHFKNWMAAMEEFDALASLGNFSFNHPDFVFPEISDSKHFYSAENLAHPLIPSAERVANSIQINGAGQMLIVTGSNMAGKSTFLRSLGVNLVLAMAGAPVCASQFVCYPVQLFSNMRVGDDLANRESTFYAELKRLKLIIEHAEKEELFILLDEILKGTNSADKLTGSIALVRQLVNTDSVGVIATHDLALGELQKEIPEKVRNYNFEVEIKNEEFFFDYKLKEGICKVLNATELMKKMGLKV
jgi:DNA mismatch repair ATPase MutS